MRTPEERAAEITAKFKDGKTSCWTFAHDTLLEPLIAEAIREAVEEAIRGRMNHAGEVRGTAAPD
jgi:hypothetical protein